jgi:predicted O-methyltransferase YrrM
VSDGVLKTAGVRVYRSMMAPLGRRALRILLAEGLPGALEEPVSFLLGDGRSLDASTRRVVERIESLRRAFARREEVVSVVHPGFDAPDARRTAHAIAYHSSVSEEWGTFLHLLARAAGARHILELGGCAGISGCYLATAPACERFVTVEGSPDLARFASEHLAAVSPAARVVEGLFAEVLDDVLETLQPAVDLAYIDGQKDAAGILPVIRRVVDRLRPGGLLVLDDIRWSRDLATLWTEMSGAGGFSYALDLGRFGVCVRDAERARPRVASLAPYTGWLRRTHHRGSRRSGEE